MTPPSPPIPDDMLAKASARRRGIILVICASATFGAAAAFTKALDGAIPVAEIILFRNMVALPVLLLLVLAQGGFAALATRNPMSHVWRTIFGLGGMAGSFYSYAHLPLATVTALGFTMPLFLTVLSIPILGEKVGWRRGVAVATGFAGVMLMVGSGIGGDEEAPWAVAACLVGAVAWAMSMITIRKMGRAGESGVAIVFWFAAGSALVAIVLVGPVWVTPSADQLVMLVCMATVSVVAQLLMTTAYRQGETSLLAPFEYAGIIWTTTLGAVFWSELPDVWDFAGIAVLVGAGLYIWHREVTLGVKR